MYYLYVLLLFINVDTRLRLMLIFWLPDLHLAVARLFYAVKLFRKKVAVFILSTTEYADRGRTPTMEQVVDPKWVISWTEIKDEFSLYMYSAYLQKNLLHSGFYST